MARQEGKNSVLIKMILLLALAGIVVLGVYMSMISRRGRTQSDEESLVLNEVQQIVLLDLEANYPKSERDVVSAYGRIIKALYGGDYSDSEFKRMEEQLLLLYDQELIDNQRNYDRALRNEVSQKKEDGYTISRYVVADKDRIVHRTRGGYECATVECLFSVKKGKVTNTDDYVFLLRKNDEGRWKILGWMINNTAARNTERQGARAEAAA